MKLSDAEVAKLQSFFKKILGEISDLQAAYPEIIVNGQLSLRYGRYDCATISLPSGKSTAYNMNQWVEAAPEMRALLAYLDKNRVE